MRIGYNPHKDKPNQDSGFSHQIIIPVYIPNFEDYFKDSFEILKLCLQSIFTTTHHKTFITIVNNGSCEPIKLYLNQLLSDNKIHEVIHTHNIGKLNAILKGLAGNSIELVTITDADVLFKNGWQQETLSIFTQIPKVGVVGIVPQFNMYKINCFNLLFDNLLNKKLRFITVKDAISLSKFYDSIGWDKNYNHDYLKYTLGLVWSNDVTVLVGCGHFVATYKKDIFKNIKTNFNYKMGGFSENYLDEKPLKNDYWRVTTQDNFAFHMGNCLEDWMLSINSDVILKNEYTSASNFKIFSKISKTKFVIKNKILQKLLKNINIYRLFLKWKKLPVNSIKKY